VWTDTRIVDWKYKSELSYHSMSTIESGKCYKIMNEGYGLVFDLSSGDNTSILGWDFHGGDNQQVSNLPYSDII
jgi:hypothetical protein